MIYTSIIFTDEAPTMKLSNKILLDSN